MLELLASDYRLFAQDVLVFSLCLAAFIWGGGPEKAVAATWLVVFEIFGRIHKAMFGSGYMLLDVDPFLATKDVAAGALWIVIALYANRNYPLWIAGTQLLAIAAHLARALADAVSPVAYAAMVIAPGWIQLLCLAAGLARHVMRRRRHGPYRDWRRGADGRRLPIVATVSNWQRAIAGVLPGKAGRDR